MTSEIFENVASSSDDSEFYSSMPEGYERGKRKYVIVLGTVLSGLGKGIFSASLGKVLQDKGLGVSPLKFDGYLNVDAGTLNPFRHGEVFVLDDGTECDMDLGNYERYLGRDLSRDNYLTSGKIFKAIIDKERKGGYLGRDVQFIPHVTGDIVFFLRNLSMKQDADVVLVEVGGTVGDIENGYFIEAMRQLAYEEGPENVCFVTLTYIVEPQSLEEQKTKAAQLGIRRLLEQGIQPNVVVCRSHRPVGRKVREKVSVYSNVPVQRVVGLEDKDSIYTVPRHLRESGVDNQILDFLHLAPKATPRQEKEAAAKWEEFVDWTENPSHAITIGITGKYTKVKDSYASILHALQHAGAVLGTAVQVKWIETTALDDPLKVADALEGLDGIIVPGGFGKRGTEGKIACVQHIREQGVPYLGLCFGFQMAVVEFARNVCGLDGANSTELGKTDHPVIDLLEEQRGLQTMGGNMRLGSRSLQLDNGTLAHELYRKADARDRFRHRYEVNPDYVERLEKAGMIFSGKADGIQKILELPGHPFFVGTQAHPEFRSRPLDPHPLFTGFVGACLEASQKQQKGDEVTVEQ